MAHDTCGRLDEAADALRRETLHGSALYGSVEAVSPREEPRRVEADLDSRLLNLDPWPLGYRGDVSGVLRIELVDDHEVVRNGLKAMLDAEDDLEVVGEAGTVEEAIRRVGFDEPDVVILDVRLPDGSGVEACREIRTRWPEVHVLMLTSFADDEALFSSILAGASGYVLKQIKGVDLIESVRKVGRGESLLDPEMTDRVFRRIRGEEQDDPLLSRLSKQERRILEFIAEGLTNRQISEEMFLAEKTVKNYVSNVLAKLEMSRRSEAAAYAARLQAEKEHRYPPEQWPS
jgi:DNA-binding NarL/FixJ family response regulator